MRYVPGPLPPEAPAYLRRELESVARASATPTLTLDVLHAEPARPRDGMVVVADGTNWNPGAGVGVYARLNGAWVKL